MDFELEGFSELDTASTPLCNIDNVKVPCYIYSNFCPSGTLCISIDLTDVSLNAFEEYQFNLTTERSNDYNGYKYPIDSGYYYLAFYVYDYS